MTSRMISRSLLALAAVTLSMSALAGQPGDAQPQARQSGHMMLKHHDVDGDGTVALQEFLDSGDKLFTQLDADGDGRLSAEEMAAARQGWGRQDRGERAHEGRRPEGRMQQRGEQRFARLDADGDGFVGRAEFDAVHTARFSRLDADGNGVIDADELPSRKDGRKGHGKGDCERRADAKR